MDVLEKDLRDLGRVRAPERRLGEIGSGFSAHRIASVAEAALRGEDAPPGLQLIRGRGLGRRGLKQKDNAERFC